MKKIILISLCLTGFLFGADLKWNSYKEGMLINEDKPKLYMLSATYCHYCKENKKMMNEEKSLNSYIENNFVTISQELDVEVVPNYLKGDITPLYYVLDKKGNIIGNPLRGFQQKETLLKFLNQQHYKFKNNKS